MCVKSWHETHAHAMLDSMPCQFFRFRRLDMTCGQRVHTAGCQSSVLPFLRSSILRSFEKMVWWSFVRNGSVWSDSCWMTSLRTTLENGSGSGNKNWDDSKMTAYSRCCDHANQVPRYRNQGTVYFASMFCVPQQAVLGGKASWMVRRLYQRAFYPSVALSVCGA